jgi:hypothetical protein
VTGIQFEAVRAVLNAMVNGPVPIDPLLRVLPGGVGSIDSNESELLDHCVRSEAGDPIVNITGSKLREWDFEDDPGDWARSTARNSRERRDAIYDALGFSPELRDRLDQLVPHFEAAAPIIIGDQHERWYSSDRRADSGFYWNRYRLHLAKVRGFGNDNLDLLDVSTSQVVERLSDPRREEAYQAKGLVVGYVQSGKTANFTGVIAKAIDAGYRLVIVLSGTLDLLRNQTQRRLDMELVGKEQICRNVAKGQSHDYADDPDWEEGFISYGSLPDDQGAPGIYRLTEAAIDFCDLGVGIPLLASERFEGQPLYSRDSLARSSARLVVAKKNSTRLKQLVDNLNGLSSDQLGEIPALIIDDESDQASVNTIRPDTKFLESERQERTAINAHITDLLRALPRAQYVGYTATPFANVFVDPDDAEGLFPKDFVLSLPRPAGYMGVAEFHDLGRELDEGDGEGEDPTKSNKAAHVRDIWYPHDESTDQLQRAIDSFVLAGAIKLYRQRTGERFVFRHHTMLAHESVKNADQEELADLIRSVWREAGYQDGSASRRLEELLREDFQTVHAARGDDLPFPGSIEEIWDLIGESIRMIEADGDPCKVVNGQNEDPDFDKVPVWSILVGGHKLSRGYTVEGLTISYFRRRATYQDTLMQMGRWFGFRPGYRDLIRLYIGRHEPLPSRKHLDLYEAFESMCLDEEHFREQLRIYAMPEDGREPLRPIDVPPIVANTHPHLSPVAPNRMWNARLKSANFGGLWMERTLLGEDPESLGHNESLFRRLLESADVSREALEVTVGNRHESPMAGIAVVGHDDFVEVLSHFRWVDDRPLFTLELDYLRGANGDPEVDDWLIVLPQIRSSFRQPWQIGPHEFASVKRSRSDAKGNLGVKRFKAFTTPAHRRIAEAVVLPGEGDLIRSSGTLEPASSRRGVCLLYPSFPPGETDPDWPDIPAMGFALLPPPNSLPVRVEFAVRDPNRPEAVVVEADDSASA